MSAAPRVTLQGVVEALISVGSLKEATKLLGVGRTCLKKQLRALGLARWPGRNVTSVRGALEAHRRWREGCAPQYAPMIEEEIRELAGWCEALLADPRRHIVDGSVVVPPQVNRIIQNWHKRAYKAKQAAAEALLGIARDGGRAKKQPRGSGGGSGGRSGGGTTGSGIGGAGGLERACMA